MAVNPSHTRLPSLYSVKLTKTLYYNLKNLDSSGPEDDMKGEDFHNHRLPSLVELEGCFST